MFNIIQDMLYLINGTLLQNLYELSIHLQKLSINNTHKYIKIFEYKGFEKNGDKKGIYC